MHTYIHTYIHIYLTSNTKRSRVFSGILLIEMASFMFLSQYRDTKAILK